MTSVLETLDWIVLSIYFLALIAVAVWVVLQKNKNTEDYFLAGTKRRLVCYRGFHFCFQHWFGARCWIGWYRI